MSQYNPANLADFSAATTAIANGTVQSSGPMQSVIRDVNARIADLNDAFRALATCQAGSSAPVNRQGGIWFDASNAKWFGDPDGSGHDDDFANGSKPTGSRSPRRARGRSSWAGRSMWILCQRTVIASPPIH
jgi:hypothetical protein